MSKSHSVDRQVAAPIFPCLPIQEIVIAHKESATTTTVLSRLWIPILKHLNPARCVQLPENLEGETKKEAYAWKERLDKMLTVSKNLALREQIKGKKFIEKLEALAPRLEQMLKDFCKSYNTLHFIPQFFTDKSFTPAFFKHLFEHYKDPRYLYLILHFIKTGKDCTSFFKLCENETLKQLFYLGIGSGVTIDQFVKSGFKFDHVDPSGGSFVHYFLLKKEEFTKATVGKSKGEDWLEKQASPVAMSEEMYLKTLKALCAQSEYTLNQWEKALDIATKAHYEKEVEILKTFEAESDTVQVEENIEEGDYVIVGC